MTTVHDDTVERRNRKARIAAWWDAYAAALTEAMASPHVDLEQLIEICWEKGLLEHVSPADSELREIRADLGRTLWPPRDDWRLYLLLQYAMEGILDGLQLGYSVFDGPHGKAVTSLIFHAGSLPLAKLQRWFPKLTHHRNWPFDQHLIALLIERAQKEVRARGGTPHEPSLRRGATGVFHDIPCKIDRVLMDGTLWLVGQEANSHLQLYDAIHGLGTDGRVYPYLIDPAKFQNPESER